MALFASGREEDPLHPVLEEIFRNNDDSIERFDIAVDILQELITRTAVSPDVIRQAAVSVVATRQRKKAPLKKSDAKSNCAGSHRDGDVQSGKANVDDTVFQKAFAADVRYRHVALQIAYDGANFSGLAENVGREDDQSIERALFEALRKAHLVVDRASSGYSRCGRTDRGVSAAGQVVALRLKSAFPLSCSWDEIGQRIIADHELPRNGYDRMAVWTVPRKKQKAKQKVPTPDESETSYNRQKRELSELPYDKILNNLLPSDIRVLGWSPVSDEFSARFSATTRVYRYFFCARQDELDLSKMREALSMMVGRHDFRNFCKMDVEKVYNFERIVHEARIVSQYKNDGKEQNSCCDHCYFEIVGQAFLWHQIRCMVSVLFMVGRGLEQPDVVAKLLDVTEITGKPSYPLADEQHLVLHHCGYPSLKFRYSTGNLWNLTCQFAREWEEASLVAARALNFLEKVQQGDVLVDELKEFAQAKLQEREKREQKYRSQKELATGLCYPEHQFSSETVSWREAANWLRSFNLVPSPNGPREARHVPLMQRSRGTTYEEKIESLQQSSKRWSRYEENVVKKRKTKEEDEAFYRRMTSQGGLQ